MLLRRTDGIQGVSPKPAQIQDPPTPPQNDSDSVHFGDPASIARRGKVRLHKYRFKKDPKKRANRYHAIWVVIDGKPTRIFCKACGSGTWVEIGRDALFADVQCAIGHPSQVLNGFYLEKPFEPEPESVMLAKTPLESEKEVNRMATKKAPAKKTAKNKPALKK